MNNFFTLTKINLKNMFKSVFSLGTSKKSTKYKVLIPILIVFLFAIIMVSSGMYFYQMSTMLVGNLNYLFLLALISSFLLVVLLVSFEASGHLFKTKDFELLSSLPIKNTTIVASKLISLFISAYLYELIILLPCTVVYFIFSPISILLIFKIFIGSILFTLVPLTIACLLSILFLYISSKFKYKTIIYVFLLFMFVVAYFYIYLKFNDILVSLVENGESIFNAVKWIIPTVAFFIDGLMVFNLNIIWFILINLLSISLLIVITGLLYKKINQSFSKNNIKSSKVGLNYKKNSIRFSLIKSESKRYFSSFTYISNTMFSLIFLIIMPIILKLLFNEPDLYAYLNQFKDYLLFIVIIISSMFCSMCNITCTSISMEGKNFYMLKCLPIKLKDIFISKILFNIILIIPFQIITSLLFIILFSEIFIASSIFLTVLNYVLLFIVPIIATISFTTIGLLINLVLPKINFDSVIQVVKQSTSVLIMMMMSMIVHMIFIVLCFIIPNITEMLMFIFIISLILLYLIIFIISVILLKKKGNILFKRI